ncbi:MAG: hypothetical protein AB9917_23865 [Negativicutes bacterium]
MNAIMDCFGGLSLKGKLIGEIALAIIRHVQAGAIKFLENLGLQNPSAMF